MSKIDDLDAEINLVIKGQDMPRPYLGSLGDIPPEFDGLNESEALMVRRVFAGKYIPTDPTSLDDLTPTGDLSSHGEYFSG